MVAFVLYRAGLHMGERLGARNYEDQDIRPYLPQRGRLAPWHDHRQLRGLVRRRDAMHARWGFKLPHATRHIRLLTRELRNPVFLVCIRNPAAVARSIARRDPPPPWLSAGLGLAVEPVSAALKVVACTDAPMLIIDTDEVVKRPGRFLDEAARLLNLQGDLRGIGQIIRERGYRQSEARRGVTFVTQ